jgi:hypothetical protein
VDSTVYPLGVTGGTTTNGPTSFHIQPVNESVFMFTNHKDEVMFFPSGNQNASGLILGTGTGYASRYTSFSTYARQITDTGGNATGYYSAPEFTSLKAKSIATFDGRAWYGNVVEGGVHFATRLRRSIVGNPLIVWPGFEITDTTPGLTLTGVGSGFIDLEQFATPIQRILPLGDLLAVYSKDGIAVVRRTGSQAAPYAIQYITLERGVLGPGAVISISPAKHFALLSDGWYIINANGTLEEVGLRKPATMRSVRSEPESNYKWKTDFYRRLDQPAADSGHLQLGYEPDQQFVRISAPVDGGGQYTDNAPTTFTISNEVWIYDIKNDRVFLDDYTSVNTQDQTPLVWEVSARPPEAEVSWTDILGGTDTPWNALDDPGSWASLRASSGGQIVSHGDQNGKVYFHSASTVTRDGDAVNWNFLTIPHNYGVPGANNRLLQRMDVQYENNQADTGDVASVTATTYSTDSGEDTTAGASQSGSISLQRGTSGEMAQEYVSFRLTGDHHQFGMSGTGAVKIHSIDLEYQLLQGRYRRKEGT